MSCHEGFAAVFEGNDSASGCTKPASTAIACQLDSPFLVTTL